MINISVMHDYNIQYRVQAQALNSAPPNRMLTLIRSSKDFIAFGSYLSLLYHNPKKRT
jgi:hypothetical protein